MFNIFKEKYYCDGICEVCNKGKLYKDKEGEYYACDPKKVRGLKVMPSIPPDYNNFNEGEYVLEK